MKRTNTAVWMEKYNRWQIKVQKDGVRKTFTSAQPGRTGQREANAKADAWLDDNIEYTNTRVDALFAGYLADLKQRTSYSHWRNEESRWRVWIAPVIGSKKISSVNDQHLQAIVNAAYQGGLAKKSLKDLRSTLTAFFKYCRKCRVTTYFPENIIIPASAPVRQKNILQPDDLAVLFSSRRTQLYQKEQDDDLINAYRLQVLTGLRPGELLGLVWQDIFDDRLLVRRSINDRGEITSGKNENAIRAILLTPLAKVVLSAQRALTGNEDAVFPGVTQNCYRKRWKRYCAFNQITATTPYEMRHTFVSVAQALPEAWVKPIVGHSRSMDTFGVYGHEFGTQAQSATEQLQAIFLALTNPSKNTSGF